MNGFITSQEAVVSEHDGKEGIFRAIVADGEIVGHILAEQKQDVYCKGGQIYDLCLYGS